MDFEFTEEQKMFQKAIQSFVQKEIAPIVVEAEEKGTCPRELFTK
ncbi:unnamed protein product, partial [marine sediment metagenome]